jgi:uncharacterized protein with beta-barrel porin domain
VGGNGGNGGEGRGGGTSGGGGGGDGAVIAGDISIEADITGGNGGNGWGAISGDGGGGAGVVMTGNGTLTNISAITGGNSGTSLNYGGGGVGVIVTAANGILNNSNAGTITGGKGLNAGAGMALSASNITINNDGTIKGGNTPSAIGRGGAGISAVSNVTITNTGSITGGNGGVNNTKNISESFTGGNGGDGSGGALGARSDSELHNFGGIGIEATTNGGNVTVITSGSISGGTVAPDPDTGDNGISNAISFGGDNNTLELRPGFSFTGNVVCTDSGATNNTLALGGTVDSTFDGAQLGTDLYQGFKVYQKKGSNTWRLSNATTATTPWTLTEGTLEISNNGALGSASGGLTFDSTGNGTLKIGSNLTGPIDNPILFSGDGIINTNGYNTVVSGSLSGSGEFIKKGAGTLELTNTSHTSFTGLTTINVGELKFNGNLSNSSLTVMSGAQLAANGAIHNLTNSGTVKPLNSSAVINVTNNFDNRSGIYVCEIDSLGGASRLNTDTAQLGGGLYVIPQAGDYSAGITYTILEATSGITGTFGTVSGASSFLEYKLNRVGNRVDLTVSPLSSPFKNIVKEGNTGLMAQYIDSLGPLPSASVLRNFENAIIPLSSAEVNEALNQLHPAPNMVLSSSVVTNEFNQINNVQSFSFLNRNSSMIKAQFQGMGADLNQLTPHIAPLQPSRGSRQEGHFGKPFQFSELYKEANTPSLSQPMRTTVGGTTLWLQQTGSYSNQESVGDGSTTMGIAGVKSTLTDTSVGADTLVAENLRLGATIGYGKTTYQLRQDYGKGRIDSYRGGFYGIGEFAEKCYVNASFFYGYQDFKGKRTLTLRDAKYTNSQSHAGYDVGAMAEVGRDFEMSKGVTVTPYGGFGGLYLHEEKYTEKAEGLNPSLTVHKHNNYLIQAKTGIQISQVFTVSGVPLYFYGKLGYTYRKHLHNSQRIKASFTGYHGSFTMFAPNKAINMVNPGIGGSVLLAKNTSLTANYNAELSPKLHTHQATLNLTYRF